MLLRPFLVQTPCGDNSLSTLLCQKLLWQYVAVDGSTLRLQVVSDLLTHDKNKSMPTIRRSKDFRPSFGALKNLRAFVPSGAPMLATMATVTTAMRNNIEARHGWLLCTDRVS